MFEMNVENFKYVQCSQSSVLGSNISAVLFTDR